MQKKFLSLFACLVLFSGLSVQLIGCTSKDSKQDAEATSDYDSAELEKLDNESTDSTDSALTSSQLPEDALGETTPAAPNESADSGNLATDTSSDTPAPLDATASNSDLSTGNETAAPPADAPTDTASTAPTETSATDIMPPAPDTSSSDTAAAGTVDTPAASVDASAQPMDNSAPAAAEPAPHKIIPLQKIAATPWKSGKVWANTVYFARPGDSLTSVSQMIYGADKTEELKRINPTYQHRDLKAGDKVYYNSPHRPEDSEKVITYYEDNGLQPKVYVAKDGDNIRAVSKKLLGYSNAWKEVWASNPVESKSKIPEGTELRYWEAASTAAAPAAPQEVATPNNEMAQNEAAAPQEQPTMPPPAEAAPQQDVAQQQAGAELPPPPPMPQAQEQLPPPPPAPDMSQNAAPPPPPPPPPAEMNPPPPPPPPAPVAMNHKEPSMNADNGMPGGMDSDTTMALAVVGVAAAGLAILIVMRKKRKQKELEQALNSDTQVGT